MVSERESLLAQLTEQQRIFLQEQLRRGKKTVFANEMAKNKGIVLPENATSEEIELLLDEWILDDYIDNGFVNTNTPCECGRPLRYQYVVRHKTTNEIRRFGINHFEEHTGIPGSLVHLIQKGFYKIDYELDEILQKVSAGWNIAEEVPLIPEGLVLPSDIQNHIDFDLPLLDRQNKRLKILIDEYLIEQSLQKPQQENSSTADPFVDYTDQFEFELFDISAKPKKTPTKTIDEKTLSNDLKETILDYLETVSSTRIICELLIKNQQAPKERYLTGKPKIYPFVSMFLDQLVTKGIIILKEKQSYDDRHYVKL